MRNVNLILVLLLVISVCASCSSLGINPSDELDTTTSSIEEESTSTSDTMAMQEGSSEVDTTIATSSDSEEEETTTIREKLAISDSFVRIKLEPFEEETEETETSEFSLSKYGEAEEDALDKYREIALDLPLSSSMSKSMASASIGLEIFGKEFEYLVLGSNSSYLLVLAVDGQLEIFNHEAELIGNYDLSSYSLNWINPDLTNPSGEITVFFEDDAGNLKILDIENGEFINLCSDFIGFNTLHEESILAQGEDYTTYNYRIDWVTLYTEMNTVFYVNTQNELVLINLVAGTFSTICGSCGYLHYSFDEFLVRGINGEFFNVHGIYYIDYYGEKIYID